MSFSQPRGWSQLRQKPSLAARAQPIFSDRKNQNLIVDSAFPSLDGTSPPKSIQQAVVKPAAPVAPPSPIDFSSVKESELAHNAHAEPILDLDVSVCRAPCLLLRKKAKFLREKASRASGNGDHKAARSLAEEAVRVDVEAQTLQLESANQIFVSKNSGLTAERIDLHGLFADEAIERLFLRLQLLTEKLDKVISTFKLEVITGWGKGQTGRAILRPTVEAFLRDNSFTFVEKFPGHFFVVVRRNSLEGCQRAMNCA